MLIDRIDHVVLNCRDAEATARWYERALGFVRETYTSPAEPGVERISLKFGPHKFNLRQTGNPKWETARIDAPGSLDICFVTEGSLATVAERWKQAGIAVTVGPVRRTGAKGPMTSIYTDDPDGNLIEVSTYAPDTAG